MQQSRGPLLGHFCRSLNENVTRAALIKFCAERSLADGTKRAPTIMRIRSSLITFGAFRGVVPRSCQSIRYSVLRSGVGWFHPVDHTVPQRRSMTAQQISDTA